MRFLVLILLLGGCAPKNYIHHNDKADEWFLDGEWWFEGAINQQTGLVVGHGKWKRAWWAEQFEAAKAKGCHLEDSCGIFPPYFMGAQFCGEPQTICPGQHWQPGKCGDKDCESRK